MTRTAETPPTAWTVPMPDEHLTTAELDDRLQETLLHVILTEPPSTRTRDGLHAIVSPDDDSFHSRDATDRALRDLRASGLIQKSGDRYDATRSAALAAALIARA
jgi:hypothetical protein